MKTNNITIHKAIYKHTYYVYIYYCICMQKIMHKYILYHICITMYI